ncbi:MAG: hypothetical protein KTR31_18495 [Myxococcales bacterium]|nr:hypothetical protein [Myxococcales bacterium]
MRRLAVWSTLCLTSCGKVPIFGVEAFFSLADVSWFEAEQTLFVFYQVEAQQGIGEPSVIEVTYATDDERVPWTSVEAFETVHTHVPVDCGPQTLCGSVSVPLALEPREVDIRLRYHRDGSLSLPAESVFNVVGSGPAHSNRSLLIYGVFEETNQQIQWRARHRFPTLRNEQVEALGLRRYFSIDERSFGTADLHTEGNPYGYGRVCPDTFMGVQLPSVETTDRAVFDLEPLPLGASDESTVCALSTVTDALGEFTAPAVARKNPETRAAFPVLRSPIRDATPLKFYLSPCDRVISEEYEEMQRQRLGLEGVQTTCIDDWESPGFVDELVVLFRDAVEAERPAARDMVLVVGVNQDETGVATVVEEALAELVPDERHRSSPRLAGAFVLDSDSRGLALPELSSSTLWCPSTIPIAGLPDASARTCPVQPDQLIEFGPLTFGQLPILPPRDQYLDFIDEFSVAQAGEMTSVRYLAPEFATTSDHIDVGEFGVVTFPNGERISADVDDAFSYCAPEEFQQIVFRSELLANDKFQKLLLKACYTGQIEGPLCDFVGVGALPIEMIGEWHAQLPEANYDLGLLWEFPFLLRMEYEAVGAASVTALGLTVPFGIASPAESFFGTQIWLQDEFPLDPALTQCTRFCDHPTFDSAGVYHVTDPFRTTYAMDCYQPSFPMLGDPGFPLDP